MADSHMTQWPLGLAPGITRPLPSQMKALVIHRDQYGPPPDVIQFQDVPVPSLHMEDAHQVLVAILATGPNFNTNFAALGLPVPVFGRGTGPPSTSRAVTPWGSWWMPVPA